MNSTPLEAVAVGRTAMVRRTPRSRFKAEVRAGLQLEPRDERLLCDLFLNRAMSRGQIQSLYFGSVVRSNARLRQLFDHGFVARYYLPAAPFGAQAVYSLGKAALSFIAGKLEMDLGTVRRHYARSKTPTFIEHTLAIVDVRIALESAAKQHKSVEVEQWLPEMLCRHEFEIRATAGNFHQKKWQKTTFKPDAFVRIRSGSSDTFSNYFVEVDLGHTSSRQFIGKLISHQQYLDSGLFREVYGSDDFHTLVITTSEKRLSNLVSLVAEHKSQLFWFATFDNVLGNQCLDANWRVPLSDDMNVLAR